MRSFSTHTVIRATPEAVWAILTRLEDYPRWNTTVTRVEGSAALGQKVTVHAKLSPGRAFPVRVTALEPPHRMVWTGGAPLRFLFKGERTFALTPLQDHSVEFTMEESFDGLLSGLIGKSIPDLQPAFDEFAACLKARAEAASENQ
ncbi:MAG: SRPBCC domain-containing protein [Polyangiaceae bacterium]|nr:SRPBCC domain-containing protein [Polyangiaceae bacterium]